MQPAIDPHFHGLQAALAGRYSIEREIGRGGMAIVYLAREVQLDRPVAIKLLLPELARDTVVRERFVREARSAARLSHPNIVPIHSVDEIDGWVFFVMTWVDGEPLREYVAHRGPLAGSDGTRIVREIALAVGHAHDLGVLHGNLTPRNVLLERTTKRVLVSDFGAGRDLDGNARGNDALTDLHGLGATAYYTLSGRHWDEAADRPVKAVARTTTPLGSLGVSVSRRVATLVDQCLAADPMKRPRSARWLAERLAVALDQKREVPAALQAFVRDYGRLGSGGALVGQVGLLAAGVAATYVTGSGLLGYGIIAAGYLVGPFVLLRRAAERLTLAGFRQGDLPRAFKAELETTREKPELAAQTTNEDRALEPAARQLPATRLDRLARLATQAVVVTSGAAILGTRSADRWWRFLFGLFDAGGPLANRTGQVFGLVVPLLVLASVVYLGRFPFKMLQSHQPADDDATGTNRAVGWHRIRVGLSGIATALHRGMERVATLLGFSGLAVAEGVWLYRAGTLLWFLMFNDISYTSIRQLPLLIATSVVPSLLLLVAGTAHAIRISRARDLDTEFWEKVWTGPIGRWAFAQIDVAANTPVASAMTHRPTEVSLGMAADSLFASLPKEVRAELADVPSIIARLQSDAEQCRVVLERADDVLNAAPDSHSELALTLQGRRDEAKANLQRVVGVLETMRINLLRLHAGTTTVRHFTTDLHAASEVTVELERLLAAQDEVDGQLRDFSDGRLPTPV